jgi:alkylhydroperoxidase family enzyme
MAVQQDGRLDSGLRDLAVLAAAASTGCSPCSTPGYWVPQTRARVLAEIRALASWRDGEVFTRLERLVMLYAEVMALTPPLPAGDLAAELRERLGEAALAELTSAVTATAAAGPAGQTGLD